METKLLVGADFHGRHEALYNLIVKFLCGNYDKLILLGDYADSWDRSNEDILRCFRLIIDYKGQLKDDFIPLIGNHDIQYLLDNNDSVTCSGYRRDLYNILNPFLLAYKDIFKVSYGIGNYLFSHAGVTAAWYLRNYEIISKWVEFCGLDKENPMFWSTLLNVLYQTSDAPILFQVGKARGGSFAGGPLWADRSELITCPYPGLYQIVGHTPINEIRKVVNFGSKGTGIKDTSITFIDVLDKREQFLSLKIET